VSGGEPSLQSELNPHKVSLADIDIDIANAHLVRRNLQDSTMTTITGDEMERLGLQVNGSLLRITGLPVDRMAEVYDVVGKLVPVAPIDAEHCTVEFSAFEKDVTPELMQEIQNIADAFPGARYSRDRAAWQVGYPPSTEYPTAVEAFGGGAAQCVAESLL
jgi:hypothetical protein